MLGHQLFSHLAKDHDARVTLRRELAQYHDFRLFTEANAYTRVDLCEEQPIEGVLADFRPQVVVNAAGAVKQAKKDILTTLKVNALLPHRLAALCKTIEARLVHMSTDCVFSGRKGNYLETDQTDPEDLYGRSKLLGEVSEKNCVTLRTSMIGQELIHKKSLLEWFLAQRGSVQGFTNAIFSGFTTIEMSRIIENLLIRSPKASGIYHVSSEPISKYDLLNTIKKALDLPIEIVPNSDLQCDRSLDSTRFRSESEYQAPTWDAMVEELAIDIVERKTYA